MLMGKTNYKTTQTTLFPKPSFLNATNKTVKLFISLYFN